MPKILLIMLNLRFRTLLNKATNNTLHGKLLLIGLHWKSHFCGAHLQCGLVITNALFKFKVVNNHKDK